MCLHARRQLHAGAARTGLGVGDVGRGWQDIRHEVGADAKWAGERGIWEGLFCNSLCTWYPGRGFIPLCAPLPLSK